MIEAITIGHLLMIMGAALLLAAAILFVSGLKYRGPEHGRGTPGYARARTGRRQAIYAAAVGAVLFVAGCCTPLSETALT